MNSVQKLYTLISGLSRAESACIALMHEQKNVVPSEQAEQDLATAKRIALYVWQISLDNVKPVEALHAANIYTAIVEEIAGRNLYASNLLAYNEDNSAECADPDQKEETIDTPEVTEPLIPVVEKAEENHTPVKKKKNHK